MTELQTDSKALDDEAIRADFPALASTESGGRLIYLDSAATTQKPSCVLDAVVGCYVDSCANVHRGAYTLAARASEAYESSRRTVARFVGAQHADEIVFTAGCTEALNLVARSLGDATLKEGDEVVVTGLEHHSNLLPWQALTARTGATLRCVPLDASGNLDLEAYGRLLGSRTRLVAVAHVSNVLGSVLPVASMARQAHAVGAVVVVDGAQAVARCSVDVAALNCDFYAFSGHKLYAPFGIGVLYAKRQHHTSMAPLMLGGGMVDEVRWDRATYADGPRRFEAGTPNLAGSVGLARAIQYLEAVGMSAVEKHDRSLVAYARAALTRVAGVRVLGDGGDVMGAVSFVHPDIHPHDLSTVCDRAGVAIRAGHHCAQPLMRHFGVAASARASFGVYNTKSDVDALITAVERAREIFAP